MNDNGSWRRKDEKQEISNKINPLKENNENKEIEKNSLQKEIEKIKSETIEKLKMENARLTETIDKMKSDINLTNRKLEIEHVRLKEEITKIKSEFNNYFDIEKSMSYFI